MSSRSSIAIFVAAAVILGLAVASPAAAQKRQETHQYENTDPASSGEDCVAGFADLYDLYSDLYDDFGWPDVTYDEEIAVGKLWEEEKLARDVYDLLEDRFKLYIFGNISEAEQNHMNMVSKLFETYGLEYDFIDLEAGEYSPDLYLGFSDVTAQDLYDDVDDRKDTISLVEALEKGVEIEVEHLCVLYDLLKDPTDEEPDLGYPDNFEATANYHIRLVAQNLAKGTRNHMRGFIAALDGHDVDYVYVPGCLDEELFTAIVDGGRESGVVDANGEPIGSCAEQDAESDGRRAGGN